MAELLNTYISTLAKPTWRVWFFIALPSVMATKKYCIRNKVDLPLIASIDLEIAGIFRCVKKNRELHAHIVALLVV